MIHRVKKITDRITISVFGTIFGIRVDHDNEYENGRVFLQVYYEAPCTHNGNIEKWTGTKRYLSQYMTDDEIVKTAYSAFELAVKHEVMEGFKVDGIILFNPHINFEELLAISHKEIKRA